MLVLRRRRGRVYRLVRSHPSAYTGTRSEATSAHPLSVVWVKSQRAKNIDIYSNGSLRFIITVYDVYFVTNAFAIKFFFFLSRRFCIIFTSQLIVRNIRFAGKSNFTERFFCPVHFFFYQQNDCALTRKHCNVCCFGY